MGHVTYAYSKYLVKSFDIHSQQDFSFTHALLYARQFKKFEGAHVPHYCYTQELQSQQGPIHIFHAALLEEFDLSQCHKFFWSAQRNPSGFHVTTPDSLDVFCVLTCIRRNPEQVSRGNFHYEEKVCDILFPGTWALSLWQKHVCLWYKNRCLLQRNPRCATGILPPHHQNLTAIFSRLIH